jgi:flagellum-specific ATP synthase
LIQLNAYVKGSDPKIDLAIAKKVEIDEFLQQKIETRAVFKDTISRLKAMFQSTQEDDY